MSNNTNNDSEVLVRVEHVSKKFCKSLKRSLWYGVKDIATELNPFGRDSNLNDSMTQSLETSRLRGEKNLDSEIKALSTALPKKRWINA